jgi:hypothetical protein
MPLAPNPPATGPVPEWPSQGNPQI